MRYSYFLDCFHNVYFIEGLKETAPYLSRSLLSRVLLGMRLAKEPHPEN